MASFTFQQAKILLAPFITSQGPADPVVGSAINFVNERFISSGMWKGNRFIHSFSVSQDPQGYNYFDTVLGIESVLRVLAVDPVNEFGEIAEIMADWFQWNDAGLGYIPPNYTGDAEVIRLGLSTANPLPSQNNSDTQRYRVIGASPETRTMYCLVRRGYVPLVNDNDLLIPSNRNAYRYGVQAYNYENVNELERAMTYWNLAYECLNNETDMYEDGVQDQVEIQTQAFAPGLIKNLI
jgi:hypothetical protein